MKRFALGLSLLLSTAAADQVGVAASLGNAQRIYGLEYQQDNGVRYGLGYGELLLARSDAALGADVAYLMPLSPLLQGYVQPYYGFGLGAGLSLPAAGIRVGLYPNVLLGANFANASPLTPFVEASAGPALSFGSAFGVTLGYGLRLGVNYRLP
ncbi:hypothetical protein [Deinococcus sp.]|uniref:hypothetical protein n=1 Tax=Deinococcus sp. TaxID=47478 RepID=UPI003CC52676